MYELLRSAPKKYASRYFQLKVGMVQLGRSWPKKGSEKPPCVGGAGKESKLSSTCTQGGGGGENKGGSF